MPDRIFPTHGDDKTTRFRPLVYPFVALALWLSFGYMVGDPVRTSTPSFEGPKELAPIRIWGVMFFIGAVVTLGTSFLYDTKWLRLALFIGGFMYLWWGFLFAFSIVHVSNASLNAPGLYWFISFVHFAGSSLTAGTLPTTPKRRET